MPDVPDLAAFALAHDALYLRALRSAAEAIRRDAESATSHRALVGRSSALLVADTIPEYLALLDEIKRLRAALIELHEASRDFILRRRIESILAGTSAVASRGPGADRNEPIA